MRLFLFLNRFACEMASLGLGCFSIDLRWIYPGFSHLTRVLPTLPKTQTGLTHLAHIQALVKYFYPKCVL
jgi:hypothetical protein